MTKEQFAEKWGWNIVNNAILSDLDAVIATEIAKAQEVKLEDAQPQPALNPIEQAYERGEKIRKKNWENQSWYKKYDENNVITNRGNVYAISMFDFNSIKNEPDLWELYTEPEQVAEPAKQPAKPFDLDRFERMFCTVVASGQWENCEIGHTEFLIEKLDAYYATKEGGNNG